MSRRWSGPGGASHRVADSQAAGIEMIYQEINVMLDSSVAENIFVGNLPMKKGLVDYKKLYAIFTSFRAITPGNRLVTCLTSSNTLIFHNLAF